MNITKEIAKTIQRSEHILISSHIRLDGDAIGSELALYRALKKLEMQSELSSHATANDRNISSTSHISEPGISARRIDVINDGPIPRVFQFLPGADNVGTSADEMCDGYDLLIALDCPALERLGEVYERLSQQGNEADTQDANADNPSTISHFPRHIINIDHHASNCSFGTINWLENDYSSTGEIVYHLINGLGVTIDADIATSLYAAIITDTGRFIQSNTTSSCLMIAGEMVERGADPGIIGAQVYRTNTVGQLQLQSLAMQTMRFSDDKKIVCMRLTQEMFERTNTYPIDTQEFVDIPRSIEGIETAILLRELDQPNMLKVSLRSTDKVNVSKIAARFGGGGHYRAAGCEFEGTLDEAERELVRMVKEELASNLNA